MPIMSKWPILHLLLLLVQQTLQPQRHTAGTKPWNKSYKSKNYFLTVRSLVFCHGSLQEIHSNLSSVGISSVLSYIYTTDDLTFLTVGICRYKIIFAGASDGTKEFHWNLENSCSKSRDFFQNAIDLVRTSHTHSANALLSKTNGDVVHRGITLGWQITHRKWCWWLMIKKFRNSFDGVIFPKALFFLACSLVKSWRSHMVIAYINLWQVLLRYLQVVEP